MLSRAASSVVVRPALLLRGGVTALRLTSNLRALFTAIPRTSSQLQSVHRNGCACCGCTGQAVRHIGQIRQSTDRELALIAQKQLQDAIKEESMPQPELPPNWTLKEAKDDVTIEVSRKYGDEEIVVRWNLDPPPDSYPEDPNQEQNPDGSSEDGSAPQQGSEDGVQETGGQSPDGEQDPLIGFSQNFTVVVSKPKANKALQFECLSDSGHVFINSLTHFDDAKSVLSTDLASIYTRNFVYQGPVISDIDADLRAMLWDYLERRGVNDELARYVLESSLHKERTGYMKWLENLRDFVKPAGFKPALPAK